MTNFKIRWSTARKTQKQIFSLFLGSFAFVLLILICFHVNRSKGTRSDANILFFFAQKHFNEWKFCSVQLQEDSFRTVPFRATSTHKTYMCCHKFNYFVNLCKLIVGLLYSEHRFYASRFLRMSRQMKHSVTWAYHIEQNLESIAHASIYVCMRKWIHISNIYEYSLFSLYTSCSFWRRFPFPVDDSCISLVQHTSVYTLICIFGYMYMYIYGIYR